MTTWYSGKLTYQKEDENGRLKTTNEAYLLDALSFTEAEARMGTMIVTGVQDFTVKAIAKANISEVFARESGENWYSCKTAFYSLDEKTGKEKRVVKNMLVNAESVADALEFITKELSGWLVPVAVEAVTLTAYLDVFPYESPVEQ